eukprot:CAMPEP_0197689746 /NCGR_PEP_ID=MMETSP1338-20131121/107324_1 /TAXON_ID=43686 ORGANISM="Pelagodinium beii, Strain RCC1491" /NCGR_SAMPLE_ID=MMETSP1338 /ASSEMBLY_ACC=CAM_ASM_000754 /LENGTH=70 /DNA_ID=CAMNT_0043272117 /DNA_START=31 /DNA_END=243 /DNA_ORIENTATION=-
MAYGSCLPNTCTSRMPSAPQNVTVKRPGSSLPPAADAAPAAAAAATPAAEAMMKRGDERERGSRGGVFAL